MKADFYEVIIERPRRGSRTGQLLRRSNRRTAKLADPESAPLHSSMHSGRQYGWNGKSLNENLRPLERFLAANIGRPWAKVYSEIRENLNLTSAVQYHVVQHLRWMVYNDVVMSEDGKPMRPAGRYTAGRKLEEIYSSNRGPVFYIHPVNGLLCKAPHRPRKKKDTGPVFKIPGTEVHAACIDSKSYLKIDGVWYEPKFEPLPENGPVWGKPTVYKVNDASYNNYGPKDMVFGKVGLTDKYGLANVSRAYGSTDVYCVGKTQLNGKELKRLGLTND